MHLAYTLFLLENSMLLMVQFSFKNITIQKQYISNEFL